MIASMLMESGLFRDNLWAILVDGIAPNWDGQDISANKRRTDRMNLLEMNI